MLSICDSYLIDERALALEPVFDRVYQTKITTKDGVFYSIESAKYLLEKACYYNASTMQGRVAATREIMKFYHRIPFVIIPLSVGVFPTSSPLDMNCAWIFNHRFVVEALGKNKSLVTFLSGDSITVPVSKYMLENQQLRLHISMSTYKELHETHRKSLWLKKKKLMQKPPNDDPLT